MIVFRRGATVAQKLDVQFERRTEASARAIERASSDPTPAKPRTKPISRVGGGDGGGKAVGRREGEQRRTPRTLCPIRCVTEATHLWIGACMGRPSPDPRSRLTFGESPVRESRTPGPVRGDRGNPAPYRDPLPPPTPSDPAGDGRSRIRVVRWLAERHAKKRRCGRTFAIEADPASPFRMSAGDVIRRFGCRRAFSAWGARAMFPIMSFDESAPVDIDLRVRGGRPRRPAWLPVHWGA